MAGGTFNTGASLESRAVNIIHNEVAAFLEFLRLQVKPDVGTKYIYVTQIPPKATRLINAKAVFDAAGLDAALIKRALETEKNYVDWTATHTADLAGVVSQAAVLRTLIENNIDEFPATYDANHQLEYVTASPAIQASLLTEIELVLDHEI